MKVLLDTDIGSDIDDAVALAYLLAQPTCDLLGITTVSGKPDLRARLASALCQVAGRDIPIFPGIDVPLGGTQRQPEVPQADALARWPHATGFPKGEAVEFMRQTIRANPGEVTLLPIGPLTNVAALFAVDEEIPRLLKGLVLMGGSFMPRTGVNGVEWNALCDPLAAAIVYRSRVPRHRSVGIEITTQVTMTAAEVRQRFQTPLLRPVLDFAEVWFRHSERLLFHDPLAAATLFDDAICEFGRGRVEVELISEKLAGLTHWIPDPAGPHEIAVHVDPARFIEHYFSVLGNQ